MKACKKKLSAVLMAGIMSWLVGGAADAADLTAVRATNEVGHTRIVLDMKGLPDGWSSIYNEKAQQVRIHFAGTANRTSGPVQYNNRNSGVLQGVGLASTDTGLDLSLSVNQPIRYHMFTLQNPDRIVLDLFNNYDQRTTKPLKDGVVYTKWDTSTDTGRVKVDALMVAPTEPAVIKADGDKAETLAEVTPTGAISVGLVNAADVAAGLNGEGLAEGTVQLASGEIIPVVPGYQITPVGVLRYIPNQGYTISVETPKLQLKEGDKIYIVSGVNRTRGADELIAYNAAYGSSTHTNVYGKEVTLRRNVVIAKGTNDSKLADADIVLSAHGAMVPVIDALRIGDIVNLQVVPTIVKISAAGTTLAQSKRIVLANGMVTDFDDDNYRGHTLLGVRPDGTLIVLLASGNYRASTGITLEQGGRMLSEFGAVTGIDAGYQRDNDLYANGTYLHRDETSFGTARYGEIIIFP